MKTTSLESDANSSMKLGHFLSTTKIKELFEEVMILRIGQRTKSRLRLIAREAATATAYFGGKYAG